MSSAISAARSSLYTLLAAHSFPGNPVQVTFGAPSAYEDQEVVALMGVEAGDEDDAVIGGARPRDEEFTLLVKVKVHDPAMASAGTVDARGWVLADEVREVVYADRTLAGALAPAGWALVSSQTSDGALSADGGGFVIFVDVRIRCKARVA